MHTPKLKERLKERTQQRSSDVDAHGSGSAGGGGAWIEQEDDVGIMMRG